MIPATVLAAYPPAVRACRWVAVRPGGGGLNGSAVWRGDGPVGPNFVLKRWPAGYSPERLRVVHQRMQAVAGFDFTPRLISTQANTTLVVASGCCWDVTTWRHGSPALLTTPGHPPSGSSIVLAQLRAAGGAVAALHRAWLPPAVLFAPCAVVARRLALLGEWEGSRPRFDRPELNAANDLVRDRHHITRSELNRVGLLHRRVIAIHGDFWPENVLFEHQTLTGVLDYGDAGSDHAEVDLARLLADVGGLDRARIDAAVRGYESANTAAPLSVPFLEVLVNTGRVCSLAHWLFRLNAPDPPPLAAALPRVRRLVALVAEDAVGTIGSVIAPPDEDAP